MPMSGTLGGYELMQQPCVKRNSLNTLANEVVSQILHNNVAVCRLHALPIYPNHQSTGGLLDSHTILRRPSRSTFSRGQACSLSRPEIEREMRHTYVTDRVLGRLARLIDISAAS